MGGSPFEYKMCIVLRMDLGMSTGKLIVQACHAAVGSSELGKKEIHKTWRRWRDEGAKKVVLRAESLKEIEELAKKAKELNIVNILIKDAGHTEVPPRNCHSLRPRAGQNRLSRQSHRHFTPDKMILLPEVICFFCQKRSLNRLEGLSGYHLARAGTSGLSSISG